MKKYTVELTAAQREELMHIISTGKAAARELTHARILYWFAEVAIVAQVFITSGVLKNIEEQVRFARARFGTYELVDFVAVLIGYAVSAEPTLLAFYERLLPFASAFMALFGRKHLPHRSTLSRYLSALDQPTVEALRSVFLDDLIRRTGHPFPPGGLWDRLGQHWLVVDVDGTKQAARQRALPSLAELPAAHRRFEQVCAPAYLGRKRGEVARTRTTDSHHWLGTFSGAGNGNYQAELTRAYETIIRYAGWLCMPLAHILIRLDGLYSTSHPCSHLGSVPSSAAKITACLICLPWRLASCNRPMSKRCIRRVEHSEPSLIVPISCSVPRDPVCA